MLARGRGARWAQTRSATGHQRTVSASEWPGGTLGAMGIPALTPRGFWTRAVVFTTIVVAYLWAALIMAREHFWFGVGFIALPVLLRLTLLVVLIVMHRPSRRPR